MLREVIDTKEDSNYYLIKLGLQVFSELEKKIILIAAVDIAQTLKNESILTLSPITADDAKNKSTSNSRVHKLSFFEHSSARLIQKDDSILEYFAHSYG